MSHTISRLLGGVSLAGLLAVLAACGSSATAGLGATSQAAEQAAAGSSSATTLNLGDQQQELETLLQASGALAGVPYKVNFVEFDSGPLVDAGFAAHRIDVGFMGPARLAGGQVGTAGRGRRRRATDRRLGVPAGQAGHHLDRPAPGQAGGLHHGNRGAGLRAEGAEDRRADSAGRPAGQRQLAAAGHRAGVRRRRRIGGQRRAEDRLPADPPRGEGAGHRGYRHSGQLRLRPGRPPHWPTRPSGPPSTTSPSG